ncbi:hypothetical protein Q669_29510 [Labrenzia sp. C1B10]|uniref:N-acetylmuramidase domain-containing protein n=1 Tax=unclassified Labrenzia TaxID=2648686 RepID=UPI0003B89237|nr:MULTISPECIES: N-acetylmuramidase domain-containing protein [unclassified Labrenzia]ERP95708.1 hypothetical protein Q669_29510 [Labrenzia sp. C1B10]ERS05774.1 hypothetical protein Q675_29075 [Labrenzia sp. C1B70]
MFTHIQMRSVEAEALKLSVDPNALLAAVKIESNGKIFADVDGKNLPLIRWEGHYFDQLVDPSKRQEARKAGLANPKAGAVKNPKSQSARWALLKRAMKIDPDAARMSISIGFGQVMVAHWKKLGYQSPAHMIEIACLGFTGQLDLMTNYIKWAGLVDELQRFDWSGFARGYNGPKYRKYGYHTKLKNAYERFAGKSSPASASSGMLRMGSEGARVRELQKLLVKHGHVLNIDGDFGPATRDAVKAFQAENGLDSDGVVGPRTSAELASFEGEPAIQSADVPATENRDVKSGVFGMGGGAALTVGGDKINDIADKLSGTGVGSLEWVSTGMYVVAGLLILGGAFWAIRGHLKSKQTFEGI